MRTELEKIYEMERLDFFVMAVNHLCDIGLRMSRKITDEDIENQKGNGLMTKEFCQELLKTTRDIANAIDGPYELLSFMSQEDIYGNDKRVIITVNDGGQIDGVYGTKNRRRTDVEIIDFCTDDPNELDEVNEYWEDIKSEIEDGTLIDIY